MKFNPLSILKNIGKGGLLVADAGAKAGIPVLTQVDVIADSVKAIKGKRKIDEEQVHKIVKSLETLKAEVPTVGKAGMLDSNRFKMTVIGLATGLLVTWGLPEEQAGQAAELIFWIVSVYLIGDTVRGSTKTLG